MQLSSAAEAEAESLNEQTEALGTVAVQLEELEENANRPCALTVAECYCMLPLVL